MKCKKVQKPLPTLRFQFDDGPTQSMPLAELEERLEKLDREIVQSSDDSELVKAASARIAERYELLARARHNYKQREKSARRCAENRAASPEEVLVWLKLQDFRRRNWREPSLNELFESCQGARVSEQKPEWHPEKKHIKKILARIHARKQSGMPSRVHY